jgi:hypothetical protein
MRRWAFAVAGLLLAASASGCAGGSTPLSTVGSSPESYSCALADTYSPAVSDPSAPSALRDRSVTLQRAGRQIALDLGTGSTQYLDPVAGGNGRLFANAQYGWRINDARSVLTDVQNIRTYNCDPTGRSSPSGRA